MDIPTKYYVELEHDGFDKEAYENAIVFAAKLALQDKGVKRVVCYIPTKRNTGFLQPFFIERAINRMFATNVNVDGYPVPLKIETKLTYARNSNGAPQDVVLAFGMDLDHLAVLDDYNCVRYIIAIPWVMELTMPWVVRWNAVEITGKQADVPTSGLSEVAKVALQELTGLINMSTGISHPSDNDRAKTYVRALHKYEASLNEDNVVSYLVTELHWTSANAKEVGLLVKKLNEKKRFQGGEKTGLRTHYKRWQEKLKDRGNSK